MPSPRIVPLSLVLATSCASGSQDTRPGVTSTVDAQAIVDTMLRPDSPTAPDREADATPATCLPRGGGQVQGSAHTVDIDLHAVSYETVAGGADITLDESGNLCTLGDVGDESLTLVFPCAEPTPGTYSVTTGLNCPGMNASAVLSKLGVVNELATGGTITIQQITDDCVAGLFTVSFATSETMTGRFSAVICQ